MIGMTQAPGSPIIHVLKIFEPNTTLCGRHSNKLWETYEADPMFIDRTRWCCKCEGNQYFINVVRPLIKGQQPVFTDQELRDMDRHANSCIFCGADRSSCGHPLESELQKGCPFDPVGAHLWRAANQNLPDHKPPVHNPPGDNPSGLNPSKDQVIVKMLADIIIGLSALLEILQSPRD